MSCVFCSAEGLKWPTAADWTHPACFVIWCDALRQPAICCSKDFSLNVTILVYWSSVRVKKILLFPPFGIKHEKQNTSVSYLVRIPLLASKVMNIFLHSLCIAKFLPTKKKCQVLHKHSIVFFGCVFIDKSQYSFDFSSHRY